MYKVSIVIPNWNGIGKIEENLLAVLKVKGVDEVVVVDDASSDNSAWVIKSQFPQIKLIIQNKNGGFGATVNHGVSKAAGDIIFLLNNDAKPSEDAATQAINHFKNPLVFSVGCNTGGSWSWAKFTNGFFWHYPAKNVPKEAHQTLWVSGGSGFFRKEIWDELNGFDSIYKPFYEEDVDLGYRATKRGFINLWEPKSHVEHYKSPGVISQHYSKSQVSKVAQRNQLFFIWKNITSVKLISEHKKNLVKMLLDHPKYWQTLLSAMIYLPKVLEKRKIEKIQGKLSDEEILAKFSQESV